MIKTIFQFKMVSIHGRILKNAYVQKEKLSNTQAPNDYLC